VPHADGIPQSRLVYRDFDDRPALRSYLCASLNWDCPSRCQRLSDPCQTPQALTLPEPVACRLPDWPLPSVGGP